MDVIEDLFSDIFKGIEEGCKTELEAVQQQYPFEPFVMKPMRFTFAEAVKVCGCRMPIAFLAASADVPDWMQVPCADAAREWFP